MQLGGRLLWMVGLPVFSGLAVVAFTIIFLYLAAYEAEKERLFQIARSHARMIEAVARFDAQTAREGWLEMEPMQATLTQLRDAYERFEGFGETGELVLGRLDEENRIQFLLRLKFGEIEVTSAPVYLTQPQYGEPIRAALAGEAGVMQALDYAGNEVLAAYEPLVGIPYESPLGVVAKVNVAEVREPFIAAGFGAFGVALVVVFASASIVRSQGLALAQRAAENERMFSGTFEQAGVGLAHVAIDGRLLRVNSSLCQILGYDHRALLGKTLHELVHPEDRATEVQEFVRLTKGNVSTFRLQLRPVCSDGESMWVRMTASMQRSANQDPLYAIVALEDVTQQVETERSLRESAERIRVITEGSNVGMFDWWIKDDRLFLSDTWKRQLGYEPEDLADSIDSWRGLLHPDDRDRALNVVDEYLEEPAGFYLNLFRLQHRDGSYRWIEARGSEILDDDGDAYRLFGIHRDLTDEVETKQQLDAVLANTKTGVWSWDVQSGVFKSDQTMRSMFGYAEGEAPNRWQEFVGRFRPDDAEGFRARMREALGGDSKQYEDTARVLLPDGSLRGYLFRATIERDNQGQAERLLGVCVDVTKNMEVEAALSQRTVELTRRNADLKQFAYVASHDLQEPLRGIAGCLQLIDRRYAGNLDDQGREIFQHAIDGAVRMKRLINDLLEYTRLDSRGEAFAWVDLNDTMSQIQLDLGELLAECSGRIEREDLPRVRAVPGQMRVLFQNLISNALKFRSQQPPVVRLRAEETDSHWRIYVEDNGIGIDPKYAERIFVIFQRLHNRSEYPGTGIGLALCKRIVERHHGVIGVEPREGGGTVFQFTLAKNPQSVEIEYE